MPNLARSGPTHRGSYAAGFIASAEGRLDDGRYVQLLAYELFETGAFRDRVPSGSPSSSRTIES
ncbi:hypothetical protein FRUB_00155 [Fimbriiglobus ruber]|uniref:Uncharacterized protein n=1 Tax=Fimbriiglobus ruber TaxID=1908690 RepID=A0A225E8Q1_9BACT|nr:hypothetical protein FRUB_00155 [Fimbriiglobus ruber]